MAKIYIETYGCALNQADSETMAGLLQERGYELCTVPENADLIIINSCTVKDKTYRNFVKRLRELQSLHTPLIVAGCITAVYANSELLRDVSFIDVNAITRIIEAVSQVLAGERIQWRRTGFDSCRLRLPKVKVNPVIEIIPIAQGCVGECAFCQTRLARGELRSYSLEDIIERIRAAIAENGVKELWLTAQDTGAYGLDSGTNLIQLLEQITRIDGEFRLRLGMANPNHLLPRVDELLDLFSDERFYKFLHIPLQSGSDRVLKAMRRKYTIAEFMKIVRRIRERFTDFSIATDVIAGFPTESEEDFRQTIQLLEEIRPAVINRSQFSPRPFTLASELQQLPSGVISERSRRLSQLVENLSAEENRRWQGWSGEVLVDLQKEPDSAVSRNFSYKPIIIPLTKSENKSIRLGQFVNIKVTATTTFHLIGESTNTH